MIRNFITRWPVRLIGKLVCVPAWSIQGMQREQVSIGYRILANMCLELRL